MLRKFFKFQYSGAMALSVATLAALIISNSFLNTIYTGFFNTLITIGVGDFIIKKSFFLWINDGLMVVFFFLVGLELKREGIEGQLSSPKKIALPILAAFGGVIMPALIYSIINWHNPIFLKGWAIPTATDIAFMLGLISLLGKKVPNHLKIIFIAIAIIDDLIAITIIAVFYTHDLSYLWLCMAFFLCGILFFLNRQNVAQRTPYILIGVLLWLCVLQSGIHATLSGVILAFSIPLYVKGKTESPLKSMEKDLHPWVSYLVLPLFAFANAGVSLKGLSSEIFYHPITLGIIFGLFFGKQIGIMLISFLVVSLKICVLPSHITWKQYYGMSIIMGIGFTMSLFVGSLSFDNATHLIITRVGVIVGSMLSGVCGYFFLKTKCLNNTTL